jgi:hypothetical protein
MICKHREDISRGGARFGFGLDSKWRHLDPFDRSPHEHRHEDDTTAAPM